MAPTSPSHWWTGRTIRGWCRGWEGCGDSWGWIPWQGWRRSSSWRLTLQTLKWKTFLELKAKFHKHSTTTITIDKQMVSNFYLKYLLMTYKTNISNSKCVHTINRQFHRLTPQAVGCNLNCAATSCTDGFCLICLLVTNSWNLLLDNQG